MCYRKCTIWLNAIPRSFILKNGMYRIQYECWFLSLRYIYAWIYAQTCNINRKSHKQLNCIWNNMIFKTRQIYFNTIQANSNVSRKDPLIVDSEGPFSKLRICWYWLSCMMIKVSLVLMILDCLCEINQLSLFYN